MKQKFTRRQTLQFASGAMIGAISPLSACTNMTETITSGYDYIIVGAGSAGCVLAARLTENPNTRVLLLEAGPATQDPLIDDPKNWFRLTFGDYIWPDQSVPQVHADGKTLATVHGKLVGGSGAMNAMIHHRPTPSDIDRWELPHWRWDDLLPMLKRSETYLDGPASDRGKSGPIKVMRLPDAPPLADATLAAADRMGYGTTSDLNGRVQIGAAINQLAFDGSKRQHSGYCYLGPALERENLVIKTGAHVTELIFDHDQCIGVTYQQGNTQFRAEAGRSILAAGALRSPALLMQAGIGPADHLRDLSIPVRAAIESVGANLHDHILVAGHNYATPTAIQDSAQHSSVAIVYANSAYSQESRDLMLNVSTTPTVFAPLHTPEYGFKTTFSFTRPQSRGQLRLASADPFLQPLIDHNVFSSSVDMNGAIAALKLSREILGAREFNAFSGVEQNLGFLTDHNAMRQLIIAGATSFGHHCGTCRMGTDEEAVVDPTLKVNATQGLYVIDASVIPEIPSCPTNALVVAMAELAASRLTKT